MLRLPFGAVGSILILACGAPPGRPTEDARESYDTVGYVDMARILRDTPSGQEVGDRLHTAEREIRSQLEDLRAELEAIATELQQAQAAETPDRENVERLAGEYQALAQRAQQAQGVAQQQLEAYRAQLTEPIVEEVREICERIGSAERFGLIIEQGSLAYGDEGVDLTERIVREMGGSTSARSGTSALIREALRSQEGEEAPAPPEGEEEPEETPPAQE
jgi:Skp family chaperone for outer membrane proteins